MNTATIPAELCMFASLPAPAARGRDRQRELMYAFEAVLPIPIDQCQLAFATDGADVIGCACNRADLKLLREKYEIVTPAEIPEWLGVREPEQCMRQLNLLRGEMRSQIRCKRQNTTFKLLSGMLCVISALVVYKLQQRALLWSQQTSMVRDDIQALYDGVLPPGQDATQPDAIRFSTMLNELARTRTGTKHQHHGDLIADFAYLLAQWPADNQSQVQQIRLNADTAQLIVSVPDNDRALEMLDYLSGLGGWDVRSREIAPTHDRVNLSVQIARNGKEQGDA